MREGPDKVNPARRHFFHVVSALAGAFVLPALSKQAQAQAQLRPGAPVPGPRPGTRPGPACMLQGTHVLSSRGTEPVENLSIGDCVVTLRGEAKPIKWIGRRRFTQGLASRWPDSVNPIRIARSALADNVPHADLYLSPMHALFIDGVLIPVKDLVNGTSISRAMPEGMRDIEYFHIELEVHEVILAEGAPVETLLITDGRENFSNFVEYERRYGRETGPAMVPYAPVLGYYRAHAHLKALLRLGVSHVVDVRDPIQVAYKRIAARATSSCLAE
jgi:hypothetical protein